MFSLMSSKSKRSTSKLSGVYDSVAVRLAGPEDESAVQRVHILDSKAVVAGGPYLIAEADAQVIAALPIAGGDVAADPFRRTAEVVALMKMRAAQIRDAGVTVDATTGTAAVQPLRTQLT